LTGAGALWRFSGKKQAKNFGFFRFRGGVDGKNMVKCNVA
jgi:hypothetical protein